MLENLKDSITLVEWPQLIKKEIKNKIEIYFEYEDNLERRFIRISGLNEAYKNVVK